MSAYEGSKMQENDQDKKQNFLGHINDKPKYTVSVDPYKENIEKGDIQIYADGVRIDHLSEQEKGEAIQDASCVSKRELKYTEDALEMYKEYHNENIMFGKQWQDGMANMIGNEIGQSLLVAQPEYRAQVINKAIKVGDVNTNLVSDGYHTFEELYDFRKMYNALLFNEWAKDFQRDVNGQVLLDLNDNAIPKYYVHKSFKHEDGEYCFGEEKTWFIISAMLPTGLISNHYKIDDWDLFKVPEVDRALFEYDGHTAQDVLERLKAL